MSQTIESNVGVVAESASVAADRPDGGSSGAAPAKILDIWSHRTRRTRVLAIVLLAVNLLLFIGLCAFVHWLHFAIPFDFSWESYTAPLRLGGETSQTLNDFVIYPISVVQKPLHAVVLGSLLASIIAVPMVIAILYRFPFALPFVASVLVFAHLPWLAITLLFSCILASVRPFRLPFRFGAALVGLLPVLLYMFLASQGGPAGTLLASPEERQLLVAPWVLAVLGAAVMLAIVLGLARLVNYRPGVVTPVLAATFASPAILFDRAIGADELAFRVLLNQCGPQSELFEPVSDASVRLVELVHRWTDAPVGEQAALQATLSGLLSGDPVARRQFSSRFSGRFQIDFMEARRRAYEACKRFIADHPRSRYIDEVLYLQARALDLRLAETELTGAAPSRVVYDSFPHVQSLAVWERLLSQYPGSPLAIVAALRSAQLRLRGGEIDEAIARLESAPREPESRLAPDPALRFDPQIDQYDVAEWLDLLRRARDDDKYGHEPATALATLDPRRAAYRSQLARLAQRYSDATIGPDLLLRWTLAERDLARRADLLQRFVEHFPESTAAIEAGLALGELLLLGPSRDDPTAHQQGIERLIAVREKAGGSIWAARARDLLQRIAPASAAASRPIINPSDESKPESPSP